MIPNYMRDVLNHSPRHRPALEDVIHATDGSMMAIAKAMGKACRELGITDFPNPFPHGVGERAHWAGHFGLQAQETVLESPAPFVEEETAPAEPAPPVEGSMMPAYGKMPNKETVKQIVFDDFGVNLNTKKMTRAALDAEAERLWMEKFE